MDSLRPDGSARDAPDPLQIATRQAARHPFLDWPGPIPFAHRGGTEAAPENTMAAFAHAWSLGYRHLETDVHATADGRLAAFHDPTLERLADRPGRIEALTAADLARLRVADSGEGVPLLDGLLEAFPEARINIDPKTDAAAELLADVLLRHGALDRVCVGSFSDARLDRLRARLGPRLCTSMGPRDIMRLKLLSLGVPGREPLGLAAQVPTRARGVRLVTPRFLAAAARRGLPVHVWTIDDAREMRRLLDLGVGGLMTDRASVLKAVLTERGEWHGGA